VVSQDMSVIAPSGSAPFVMERQGAPPVSRMPRLFHESIVTLVTLSSDQTAILSQSAMLFVAVFVLHVAASLFVAEVYMPVLSPNIFLIWRMDMQLMWGLYNVQYVHISRMHNVIYTTTVLL
jgi:hypothetical protein